MFGDYVEENEEYHRVLWGASDWTPSQESSEAEEYFDKTSVQYQPECTARERNTIDYLAKIGVSSNVISSC